MTDYEELFPIDKMTLDELKQLADDLRKIRFKLVERIQHLESPPALGVNVNDAIKTNDRAG